MKLRAIFSSAVVALLCLPPFIHFSSAQTPPSADARFKSLFECIGALRVPAAASNSASEKFFLVQRFSNSSTASPFVTLGKDGFVFMNAKGANVVVPSAELPSQDRLPLRQISLQVLDIRKQSVMMAKVSVPGESKQAVYASYFIDASPDQTADEPGYVVKNLFDFEKKHLRAVTQSPLDFEQTLTLLRTPIKLAYPAPDSRALTTEDRQNLHARLFQTPRALKSNFVKYSTMNFINPEELAKIQQELDQQRVKLKACGDIRDAVFVDAAQQQAARLKAFDDLVAFEIRQAQPAPAGASAPSSTVKK